MIRVATMLLLFSIFVNAGAVFLTTTGAVPVNVSGSSVNCDQVSNPEDYDVCSAQSAAEDPTDGSSTDGSGTLFATYTALTSTLTTLLTAVSPAAKLMLSVGVPRAVVTYLWSGVGIVIGLGTAEFLRGFRTS